MPSYCRPQTVKRQLTSRWEAAEDVDAELQGVIRVLSDFITPLWNAHVTELILTGAEQRRWPILANWT
jgi:hypothetical protein